MRYILDNPGYKVIYIWLPLKKQTQNLPAGFW